jgi:hypothetical protein
VTAQIAIGADRFEEKALAFRQHTTQAPLFERVRKNLGPREGAMEMYHLAATNKPRQAKHETDLFEDVIEGSEDDAGTGVARAVRPA